MAYNRYTYALGNPLKFVDPSGNCNVLVNGSHDWQGDGECWQTAFAIYGYGHGERGFADDWNITPDRWLQEIAGQSYATSDYLKPFHDKYERAFRNRTGLHSADELHEPPPHPIGPLAAACNRWDCYALLLDTGSLLLSVASDAALVGCATLTEGGCLLVAIGVKAGDVALTYESFRSTANQYYTTREASDVDLAIALTSALGSIIPGVGEGTGIISLGWDLADPYIDDETRWSPGSAK